VLQSRHEALHWLIRELERLTGGHAREPETSGTVISISAMRKPCIFVVSTIMCLSGLVLSSCGGNESKSVPVQGQASEQSDAPSLSDCIGRWNSDLPNENITQAQPGMRAMVFTYAGSECGVALDLSGTGADQDQKVLAIFVHRGPKKPKGNFISMLVTINDGGGVDQLIQGAFSISGMTVANTNASFGEGLALSASGDRPIVRTAVSGAPNGNYPTQPETMVKRFNYSLNASDWSKLSQQQQLDAIAQFFTDNRDVCQRKSIIGTAKAYRSGQLSPTRDGMQTTLWLACVYFGTGIDPTSSSSTAAVKPDLTRQAQPERSVIVESGGWKPGQQTSYYQEPVDWSITDRHWSFTGFTWTDWGSPSAIGHGTIENGATANPAFYKEQTEVVLSKIETCEGRPHYTKMTYVLEGKPMEARLYGCKLG